MLGTAPRDSRAASPIIVVLGTTASGKSEVAAHLAERLGGEVVGCDSMQVYRRFDAGTAKPSAAIRARVPHHLIDFVQPDVDFSLGDYVRLAQDALEEIRSRGRRVVIAGGTGLYLRGLLRGVFEGPRRDEALRSRLLRLEERYPDHPLHKVLRRVDPEAARRLSPRDRQRIVRALEVYFLTGRPLSAHLGTEGFGKERWSALKIGLSMPRETLARRIEERVARFMTSGWEEEVRGLLDKGPPESANAWKALGYRQVARLVRGQIGRAEAIAAIVLETVQYAKRQMTWFRREPDVTWFMHDGALPLQEIEAICGARASGGLC